MGAVLIAAVTGLIATHWCGRRGGVVIGAMVLSHWVLDLVVHRADPVLLPANVGDLRMGLGLWRVEWASVTVEGVILLVGAFLYWRAATATQRASTAGGTRTAVLATGLIVLSGAIALSLDVRAA